MKLFEEIFNLDSSSDGMRIFRIILAVLAVLFVIFIVTTGKFSRRNYRILMDFS